MLAVLMGEPPAHMVSSSRNDPVSLELHCGFSAGRVLCVQYLCNLEVRYVGTLDMWDEIFVGGCFWSELSISTFCREKMDQQECRFPPVISLSVGSRWTSTWFVLGFKSDDAKAALAGWL